jgi:L-fuconolactonase
MIDFPIVDSHLHVWDPNYIDYPWLHKNQLLNKKFMLDEYNKACGEIKVEKMVFVQCECNTSQFMKEYEWVSELAKKDTRIQAIIPWAPLDRGEAVKEVLDELSQNKLVKGIRRIIEFEEDMEFCLQPGFVKGVKLLSDYNFSFDINIAHHQFENTIKFVRQCPNVQFILDHAGKPCIKENIFDSWKKSLKELSRMPNVYCKLSGLVTEADWKNWTIKDLRPYIYELIECFGFDRVAFGGDWPVLTQASSYERWLDSLDNALKGLSKDELHKVYYDTAVKFYRM